MVTWFLIGGDLYTAYTFIAVPALMFGAGAIGFFAVPYTIMVYPILYLVFPRLWSVAHKHGYVTSADFVRGRFGNRWLALAIALHRHPGDDAVHRAAARRHPGGDRRHGDRDQRPRRRPAADHRLRHPRRLHLHVRPARAGDDRHRQGPADLHHRDRRDHRGADPSRRLRQDVRARSRRPSCCSPRRPPARSAASASTPRSRSARRWRCSCIRTRSPAS